MNIAIVEDHPSEAARLAGLVEEYAAQARVPVSVRTFHGAEALLEGYRPYAYVQYVSTHRDERGIGLRSIASIAEKYRGTASFKHNGDEFYTDVVLPLTHETLQ